MISPSLETTMRTKSWCQQHNSWCSTHMKSRNFQLRISCNLERNLRIWPRKLQLRIREISESDLESFNSKCWKSVSSFSKSSAPKELFWLTERKERKREEKKSLNCWKAKKKDVSSSVDAEQICLNLRLWILYLLLKTPSLTHTHTRKKLWMASTPNCAHQSKPTKSLKNFKT